MSDRPSEQTDAELSDAALEELRRQPFQERVQHVLEVMRKAGVDWRGILVWTTTNRPLPEEAVRLLALLGIGVRVVPIETMQEGQ